MEDHCEQQHVVGVPGQHVGLPGQQVPGQQVPCHVSGQVPGQQVAVQHVFSVPGHITEMKCRVCDKMAGMAAVVLPCGHHFCRRCLGLWVGIYVDMYRGEQSEFPCQLCWKLCVLPAGVSLLTQQHQAQDAQLDNLATQHQTQNAQLDNLASQMNHMTMTGGEEMTQHSHTAMMPSGEDCISSLHADCRPGRHATDLYDHGNFNTSRGDSGTALCCSWSNKARTSHYM